MKKQLFVACSVLALSVPAAVVTLDGTTEYAVAGTSVTNVVSDTLTGSGSIKKTGTGHLVLAGEGNDFSGGVSIAGGCVWANTLDAFGTGIVTVPGANGGVYFNVAPANAGDYSLFTNRFDFTGSAGVNANYYSMLFYENTHLTGDITATRNIRLRHNPVNTESPLNGGPSTIFDGNISASGTIVYLNLYGTMTMNGALSAATLWGGEVWSGGGLLVLNNPANAIDFMYIESNRVLCGDTNVLRGTEIAWRYPGGPREGTSLIDMNGFDQTIGGVKMHDANDVRRLWCAATYVCITSPAPTTLTITGLSHDCTAWIRLLKAVSLVVDAQAYPGFTQTFAYHDSTFFGTTRVKAGTLALTENARFSGTPSITVDAGATFLNASTNALPSLASVTNLVLNGTFDASQASANPFDATLDNLELGDGAVFALPEGSMVRTKRVTFGGNTYTSGLFTTNTVPQMRGGTIIVGSGGETSAAWTGAVSENISESGNWDDESINIASGAAFTWFAKSGNAATVDTDAYLRGLGFRAAEGEDGFTLSRGGSRTVVIADGGRIEACTNDASGAALHTYMIDAPLSLLGDVSVHVDTNQTLIVSNAFHDTAVNMGASSFTIDGTDINADKRYGRVVFAGTNWYGGALVSTASLWKVTGLLANPDNAYTGDPEANGNADRAISLQIDKSDIRQSHVGSANYGIQLDNAVIGKSILIYAPISISALTTMKGTTNEVKGFVRYSSSASNWHKVNLANDSELILSGGLRSSHTFRLFGEGTLRIRNRPARCASSNGFNPQTGRSVFEVPGNYFNYLCVGYNAHANYKPIVEMTVNYAMTNGLVQVAGNGASIDSCTGLATGTYTLDIHATTQRCQRLAVHPQGILTGEYPGMLDIYEGRRPATDKPGYMVNGQVNGGVGLHQCGVGTLTFTNHVFASCGDLEVSAGTLEFTDDATWLNGTNVTVRGSGTLKLAAGGRFNGLHAVLHLGAETDTWKIDIPAGQTQAFAYAYDADGNLLPSGDYGNAASGAARQRFAAHFTGNGVIRVRRHGTQLLIR